LSATLFTSLAHIYVVIENWRRDYNPERPHSVLSNLTPLAYAARNAYAAQQPGVPRSTTGFVPKAAATPGISASNDE
jgi:hypothetical protein